MKTRCFDQVIKILLMSLFFIVVSTPLAVTDNNYTIKSYDVNISINNNNIYNVTETILVYFSQESVGITKRIPIKYYNYKHNVSDINIINEENILYNYTLEKDGDYLDIEIGSPDQLISGYKTYIISYYYDMGEDIYSYRDEINWNILNNTWNSNIYRCNFKVELPKSFTHSNIMLSTDASKARDDSSVIWDVRDNTIFGNTIRALNPNEVLILTISLPNKYFLDVTQKPKNIIPNVLIVGIFIIFTLSLISYLEFKLNRRSIKPNTSHTPPFNLNCAEIKYLYNHSLDTHDVNSIMMQWANKGFIKIEKKLLKHLGVFATTEFFITKTSDIKSEDDYEINFFNAIFSLGQSISLYKNRFKIKKLAFKARLNVISKIKTQYKPFDTFYSTRLIFIKCSALIILVSVISNFFYFVTWDLPFSLSIGGLFSLVIHWIYTNLLILQNGQKRATSISYIISYLLKFGITLFILLFAVIGLVINISLSIPIYSIIGNETTVQIFLLYIVMYLIIRKFTINTFKLNHVAIDKINEVVGFAHFIESKGTEKLEAGLKEHPHLFFEILPYSISLRNYNMWVSKFNASSTPPVKPEWYITDANFDVKKFASDMYKMMYE